MFTEWKLRGPVRTLRTEFAEWDITKEQWQPPRRSSVAQLRPDGRVDEQEDHNPNGSISRSRYSYDESGRLLESTFQLDDGPISKSVYRYDDLGRIARNIRVDGEGILIFNALTSNAEKSAITTQIELFGWNPTAAW